MRLSFFLFFLFFHSGDNCFAEDWNFINGGNSDCQMCFFSPMDSKILFKLSYLLNAHCTYIAVQSTDNPNYAYRVCHFSELNSEYKVGNWIGRARNEGSSGATHLHFVLYKSLMTMDIAILSGGNILTSSIGGTINPANLTDLCFEKPLIFGLM